MAGGVAPVTTPVAAPGIGPTAAEAAAPSPPARPRRHRWPLLPVGPVIVAVVGVATAVAIALAALAQLQSVSDQAASARVRALATVLAGRVASIPAPRRAAFVGQMVRATGTTFLLARPSGALVTEGAAAWNREVVRGLLAEGEGFTTEGGTRYRFAVATLEDRSAPLSVVALVSAPSPATGTVRLTNAVGLLTMLLVGVAIIVTSVFVRSVRDDVAYVRRRIEELAARGTVEGGGGEGAAVPLRSLDQVGLLTHALNTLLGRFAAAERSYGADLRAAAQLDRERSQFLAGLSHELRTPLNAILGFTHLLESEDDGPLSADAKEALATIRASGEHLKSLIDDIIELSAIETGQLRLSRVVVDVFGVASEVVREAQPTLKGRPLIVRVRSGYPAFAWADPRRVRQIITNLVTNAVKATVQGAVEVRVGSEGNYVRLDVLDTGRGIAPSVLASIFEPYRQAGDAVARRGGAGLGLAITRRLVVLHGGRIDARSELGRGSAFSVWLPDETHSSHVPRDSIVPFSDLPAEIEAAVSSASSRRPRR
ncbi:MAG: HAMP domain-containing sensor histidine kinase [Myxococcota bacterium]